MQRKFCSRHFYSRKIPNSTWYRALEAHRIRCCPAAPQVRHNPATGRLTENKSSLITPNRMDQTCAFWIALLRRSKSCPARMDFHKRDGHRMEKISPRLTAGRGRLFCIRRKRKVGRCLRKPTHHEECAGPRTANLFTTGDGRSRAGGLSNSTHT